MKDDHEAQVDDDSEGITLGEAPYPKPDIDSYPLSRLKELVKDMAHRLPYPKTPL